MRIPVLLPLLVLAAGCAATDERAEELDPIDDFIRANELEEVREVRSYDQVNGTVINDYYVILETRRDQYLAAYARRCFQSRPGRVDPDYRRDAHVIRSGVDTYRGCRIGAIYKLDEAQAEEVLLIEAED